ncbi:MAG: PEP/pyruvate-binding domain-containing protein [Desulfocapsaceae bacterium]|nr:PEP/pyruvate-binding domain-containing protein [Desulfocapsaceae bacterium]
MKNILHQVGQLFQKKEQMTVPFKLIFADFKKILNLNNQILDLIADANDKLSGDYIFDEQYIHATCHQLTDLVRELIVLINHLTQQKYSDLYNSFHHIEENIEAILQGAVLCPVKDYILPYASITRDLIDAVGGKNANLAEIGSVLGLPIPEGFAITTAAFSLFWSENNLEEEVAAIIEQWEQKTLSDEEMAWKIQRMIFDSTVPAKLEKEILDAASNLSKGKQDATPSFAIRSSAQGEDGVFSFAGQYRSCLNIPLKNIPQAYKEVVASLYSPEAMEYRRRKDFRANEIKMSVACQLMIPAKTSGVMYSYDPVLPEEETLVISSAWGLGDPIVSGKVATDLFVLDRQPPHEVKEVQVVRKEQSMNLHGSGGTGMEPVREEQRTQPSLKNQQLKDLAQIGLQLEKYFKKPQDVEFSIDQQDRIIVLQSRQLSLQQEQMPRASDLTDIIGKYPILMQGKGIAAMKGIASGPVWVLEHDGDLQNFPMGAILVARYASPQLARVIHKASGFITDIGSTTGHLATVAREFRVPALFNTENAITLLKHGQEITLDTESLTVYEGIVHELHYYTFHEEPIEEMYEYRLLRRILKKIEPLNLFDPHDENFIPQGCRTYHDLTRFVHEKAVETIIDLNFYHTHQRDTQAGQLLWDYPLDLILIDVGGGIEGEHDKGIRPEQIRSIPMQTLLQGMSHPGIWDMSPVKVDFGSFMSSLTRTPPTRSSQPEDIGRNLAVISAEYTNINFRLGYHFTVIDAYLSDNILDNHIYFRFSGGVTDTVRRSRRTSLLNKILSHYDFLCEQHGDIIVGRLKRMNKKSMLKRLFLLGLLIGFTRQLDVKMVSDAKIPVYFEQIKTIMEESHGK